MCHPNTDRNAVKTAGADDEAPTPADPQQRFVPEYYKLGQMPDEADVLDVCAAAGFDAKAYLVIETIHKLLRFDKKGYALKDLNKALEQLARLRDIVQAEYDSYHEKQRERNRSGEVVFVPFVGPSGEVLCGHGDKPCPNPDRCRKQGCQQ